MTGLLVAILAVIAGGLGFVLGCWYERNRGGPRKYEQVDQITRWVKQESASHRLADLTEAKLIQVCRLVLNNNFTLKAARLVGIKRWQWEEVKETWARAGILKCEPDTKPALLEEARPTVCRLLEQTCKSKQGYVPAYKDEQINANAPQIVKLPQQGGMGDLDPKDGWKPIPR